MKTKAGLSLKVLEKTRVSHPVAALVTYCCQFSVYLQNLNNGTPNIVGNFGSN